VIQDLITVTGPKGGVIHYVPFEPIAELLTPTLCGRPEPKSGWVETDDASNNANRSGFCERCLRKAAGQ
jgi:hypothetical protein